MGLEDIFGLHPRASPVEVIRAIRRSRSMRELRLLRPRIVRMQSYNVGGHVDCLIAYKRKMNQLQKEGRYNEDQN